MALLWNPVPIPVFNPSTGERADGALAYFYVGGTPTTPLRVYPTDDGAGNPYSNPVVADGNGVFPPIFIPYGPYGYRITTKTGTAIGDAVLTVQNPAPPDSGGGGGIVVTQDQIIQTGTPLWIPMTGVFPGFVRMNGNTIGNSGSGATERANSDTEALFTWYWNKLNDTIAPVSGGRGATPAADFAANKTITLIKSQNKAFFGLDGMGGTAGGGFAGVTFAQGDKDTPGANGGATRRSLTTGNLPSFTPSGSVSGSVTTGDPATTSGTGSTAPPQETTFWKGTGSSSKAISASFTGNSIGGNQAFDTVSPFLLGTVYQKL